MFNLKAVRALIGDELNLLKDVCVRVEGGLITKITSGQNHDESPGETIDLGDTTLLPGLIDAHMHTFGLSSLGLHALNTEREPYRALRAAAELGELLDAGFTSARCLGSSVGPDLRRAIAEGYVKAPRLITAGEFISSTGGTWDAGPLPSSWSRHRMAIADGPEAIVQTVRERVRAGSDFIKLGLSKGRRHDHNTAWGDDPDRQVLALSDAEVRAAVQEAHRNGMPVSAHAIGEAAVRQALECGVDIIEHGYAITDYTRAELARSKRPVVTTISQLYFHKAAYDGFNYSTEERETYDRHWDAMKLSFELGLEAGINFVLGTDLIGKPTHPLNQAVKEFELAVEWGMSPLQALIAGTIGGARVLGLDSQTGSLVPGKRADLIAVSGNPLDSIQALANPRFVMLGGTIVNSTDTR